MKHKHTPGPWEAVKVNWDHMYIRHALRGDAHVPGYIADVYNIGKSYEANARLIAASPCLLAELQHAHQIILNAVAIMTPEQKSALAQANERDGCDGDGATRHHERAEVIAKATGSQP